MRDTALRRLILLMQWRSENHPMNEKTLQCRF
jgi:hypothetical protein